MKSVFFVIIFLAIAALFFGFREYQSNKFADEMMRQTSEDFEKKRQQQDECVRNMGSCSISGTCGDSLLLRSDDIGLRQREQCEKAWRAATAR